MPRPIRTLYQTINNIAAVILNLKPRLDTRSRFISARWRVCRSPVNHAVSLATADFLLSLNAPNSEPRAPPSNHGKTVCLTSTTHIRNECHWSHLIT